MLGLGNVTSHSLLAAVVAGVSEVSFDLKMNSIVAPAIDFQGNQRLSINVVKDPAFLSTDPDSYYTWQAIVEGKGENIGDRLNGTAEITLTDPDTQQDYVATAYLFRDQDALQLLTIKLGPVDEQTLSDDTFAATDFTPNMPTIPTGEIDAWAFKVRLKSFGDIEVDGVNYVTNDGPYMPLTASLVFIIGA